MSRPWATVGVASLLLSLLAFSSPSAATCTWSRVGLAKHLGVLWDVSSSGPDDVWTSGYLSVRGRQRPVLMHDDGTGWADVKAVLEAPNDGYRIGDVAAVAPDDVWVVGAYKDPAGGERPLLLHWNGVSWAQSYVATSSSVMMLEADARATDDVWAIGFEGPKNEPLVLHYDGLGWAVVPVPTGSVFPTDIEAVAPDDVWAGGSRGARTYLIHWNGTTWTSVSVPKGSMRYNSIQGLHALASDDVWAVGITQDGTGTTLPMAWHWDGTSWSVTPTPSPGTYSTFNDVAFDPDGRGWAVGYSSVGPVLARWTGVKWRRAVPPTNGRGFVLGAVTAPAPGSFVAVGSRGDYSYVLEAC